jgi:Acyl CoA binding protein
MMLPKRKNRKRFDILIRETTLSFFLDFTGKYKWDAWKKNEGLSQDDAKSQYVAALIAILEKNGEQDDAKQWLSQLKD